MAKKPKPKASFKTGAQMVVSTGNKDPRRGKTPSGARQRHSAYRERKFEDMLRDPTIRLAVDVVVAMLKRQPWAVEGADKRRCDFMLKQLEPHREKIIRSVVQGYLKKGWRGFEVSYGVDPEFNVNCITGVKALKPTLASPLSYVDTGEFAGFEVESLDGKEAVIVDERHSLFVNFDEEGYGELGEPLLRISEGPYDKWEDCDEGARRYDQKCAGGFLFIQYPVGKTPYSRAGGAETDNAEIMVDLANSFEAAGYGGVPVVVDPDTGEPINAAWHVEYIAVGGSLQPGFASREKYLDALKLRAFGIPERSTTEGTFGTKAEAEAHADIAVIVNLDRHDRMITGINDGPIRALNEANWQNPDETKLVLGKLDPQDRDLFASIFTSLMTDPVFGEKIAGQVSVPQLLDKLNIPTLEADEQPLITPPIPILPGAGAQPSAQPGARPNLPQNPQKFGQNGSPQQQVV